MVLNCAFWGVQSLLIQAFFPPIAYDTVEPKVHQELNEGPNQSQNKSDRKEKRERMLGSEVTVFLQASSHQCHAVPETWVLTPTSKHMDILP